MAKRLMELKARCPHPARVRQCMEAEGRKLWEGRQVDTYFRVSRGRLKLRRVEGSRQGTLIYYEREDVRGAKRSRVRLVDVPEAEPLDQLLQEALGVLVVVNKKREVYRWGRVQVHLDDVHGLGTFVEFERGLSEGEEEAALIEFDYLISILGLREEDFVAVSYSDLLMDVS